MEITIILSLLAFVGVLGLIIWLRLRVSKFEIKTTDIVVALLPVLLFLLITGKIKTFEFGDIRIETAFVKASASEIVKQVTPLRGLPTQPVRIDPKRGVEDIPRLIDQKTEGLLFRLGYGRYWGPAIEEYLFRLTRYPFLKYLVLEDEDGRFFGLADAREVSALLQSEPPPFTAADFARWLNKSQKEAFSRLPGFIGADQAVSEATDKAEALRRMEELDRDVLPVKNSEDRFAGVVNRSRLTASLIIDVTRQIQED